jgi:glycosyltransferase involved in cell wall biosynthesis
MKSVLLDFSNLRAGGALQMASALLHDLTDPAIAGDFAWLGPQTDIWISPGVATNLVDEVSAFPGNVTIKETPQSVLAPLKRARTDYDVRFVHFGPTYSGRMARREILGFAEVTMVYRPKEYARPERPTLREVVGNAVKRRMVHRADLFHAETHAIKERMVRQFGLKAEQIEVIPARPHPLFRGQPIFDPPAAGREDGALHVAYVTRAYPHKNISFIGPVSDLYQQRTGRRLVVHVTLRDAEIQAFPESVRRWMHNHGELKPAQVLDVYRTVDAFFFPSLLEASSSTPLEANVLGIPLVAADRDFVRTPSKPTELFEPLDPASAVNALIRFEGRRDEAWAQARKVAQRYRDELNAVSRTRLYLEMIDRELKSLRT